METYQFLYSLTGALLNAPDLQHTSRCSASLRVQFILQSMSDKKALQWEPCFTSNVSGTPNLQRPNNVLVACSRSCFILKSCVPPVPHVNHLSLVVVCPVLSLLFSAAFLPWSLNRPRLLWSMLVHWAFLLLCLSVLGLVMFLCLGFFQFLVSCFLALRCRVTFALFFSVNEPVFT